MRIRTLFLLTAFMASLAPALSHAQESDPPRANVQSGARDGVLKLLPTDSVTEHALTIGGRKLAYTATAGTLDLFGQDGAQTGAIFYTAYVARDSGANRPLTFAFNGGPGAASAFLHLGLVGPKVLDFGTDGRDGANAKLVDNPQSWLDFTDLVLIDPIGTAGAERQRPTTPPTITTSVPMLRASPRRSRSMSRTTTVPTRRNIFSAKVMAASAPPRSPRRCRKARASSSPVR